MKTLFMTLGALMFLGCTQQAKHPIQLEDNQRQNISFNILSKNKTRVPLDEFFSSKYWHYKQTKDHGYGYFRNDEIVATFYLAHHATYIYIRGNAHTIKKYKNYFLKNQVAATIKLIPLHVKRRGEVIIDYFRITQLIEGKIDITKDEMKSGKNLLAPSSDVIEIPKDYLEGF